ncbi:hypothetical protein BJY01DRAFT_250546 [Aspergillus pseudoustus]|uniref:Suppressor of anucleate metulae protein B n=1 Tax=Aspergillus pseudoustus TaxID=1810923 RepID=A0ABR4JHP0_9EURO
MSSPSSTSLPEKPPVSLTDIARFPLVSFLPDIQSPELDLGLGLNHTDKQWCFAAEIVSIDSSEPYHTILEVRDRIGKQVRVVFICPLESFPKHRLETGQVILILRAVTQAILKDGKKGVLVQDAAKVKVLPFELNTLIKVNEHASFYNKAHKEGKLCHGCMQPKERLRACPECHFYYSCSADCAKKGFNSKHHDLACLILRDKDVAALLAGSFDDLEVFSSFSLIL